MAITNWSMSILGYPAHSRSAARVVGVSHMSTHEALRFAEHQGLSAGWLLAEGSQPQLERVRQGTPLGVSLVELFTDSKVVKTEGLASGSLVFVAAALHRGQPPVDRSLSAWADENRHPWVEVVDNEVAYWGNLSDPQIERLMTLFLCRHPVDGDWRTTEWNPRSSARLRTGLFEHGWTRNLDLARKKPHSQCDLWGGIHRTCVVEHAGRPLPTQVQVGVRVVYEAGRWETKELVDETVPLQDETGKLTFGSGLYRT